MSDLGVGELQQQATSNNLDSGRNRTPGRDHAYLTLEQLSTFTYPSELHPISMRYNPALSVIVCNLCNELVPPKGALSHANKDRKSTYGEGLHSLPKGASVATVTKKFLSNLSEPHPSLGTSWVPIPTVKVFEGYRCSLSSCPDKFWTLKKNVVLHARETHPSLSSSAKKCTFQQFGYRGKSWEVVGSSSSPAAVETSLLSSAPVESQLPSVEPGIPTQRERSTFAPSFNLSSTSQAIRPHSLSRFPQSSQTDSRIPPRSSTAQPSPTSITRIKLQPLSAAATAFIPSRPNFFAQFASFSVPSPTGPSPASASTKPSSDVEEALQHVSYSSSPRKRSRLSPSNVSSDLSRKKRQIHSPSPDTLVISSASPSLSLPAQGGIWISAEIAREGLEVLEKIKKNWERLDHEWNELVAAGAGAKKD